MSKRFGLLLVVVVVTGIGSILIGCGAGDSTTVTETVGSSSSAPDSPSSSQLTGCPEARESLKFTEEIKETAELGIESGKEVEASEKLLADSEKRLREIPGSCKVEKELKFHENKICRNSPQDLAEALEVEDTPGNREYIEVYEATCGERVPIP